MFESFSAFGSFVQTPCGPRKSGMPDSVEMPAPVRATMRVALASQRRTSSTWRATAGPRPLACPSLSFVPAELYCAQTPQADVIQGYGDRPVTERRAPAD